MSRVDDPPRGTAYAFDLDGTLLRDELLPLLAELGGCHEEVRALTDSTMSGDIPFEDSFRRRCAMLRHVPLPVVHAVVARASLDTHMADFIARRPDDCYIVTGNLDAWVRPIARRLGCGLFASTARVRGGRVTGVSAVLAKDEAVRRLRLRHRRVVSTGDGANDVPMFRASDVSIAFGQTRRPCSALIRSSDYLVSTGESLCRLLNTL